MSDDTQDQLSNAKLDLLRGEMRAGFAAVQQAIIVHANEDEKAHKKMEELEDRMRLMEIESARAQTKMQVIGLILSLCSGGAGAFASKLF